MHTLKQLEETYKLVPLSDSQREWLHMLRSDWQILADLASADLVLWLPTLDGRFVAVALCRSATAATLHVDDVVGLYASQPRTQVLQQAMDTCQVMDAAPVHWAGMYSVSIQCVPVTRDGECFAVVTRDTNVASPARHGPDQVWAEEVANVLVEMIARGEHPSKENPGPHEHGAPRFMDGAILIDQDGIVREMTPNGNSAMRRLGIRHDLVGRSLIEDVTNLLRKESQIEETLAVVAMGRAAWWVDVEANNSAVRLRALPLKHEGQPLGALLLTRDVTETRRREKEIMSKDATIREIHHRVKNNLQTVSALLRMQERRSASDDVKEALRDAGRRVESIATVHEALSQNVEEIVDFDRVATSMLRLAVRVASVGPSVNLIMDGTFGRLPADQASALATVLTELVSNSAEHAYLHRGGNVWVAADAQDGELTVTVEDEGVGLQDRPLSAGLGTQIAKMMVNAELDGTIDWHERPGGGTVVSLRFQPALEAEPEAVEE